MLLVVVQHKLHLMMHIIRCCLLYSIRFFCSHMSGPFVLFKDVSWDEHGSPMSVEEHREIFLAIRRNNKADAYFICFWLPHLTMSRVLSFLLEELGQSRVQCFVWVKENDVRKSQTRVISCYEHLIVAYVGPARASNIWTGFCTTFRTNVLKYANKKNKTNRAAPNPAEMPVDLQVDLIQACKLSLRVATGNVLDLCSGSGSFTQAAWVCDLNSFAVEKEDLQCQAIVDRMSRHATLRGDASNLGFTQTQLAFGGTGEEPPRPGNALHTLLFFVHLSMCKEKGSKKRKTTGRFVSY